MIYNYAEKNHLKKIPVLVMLCSLAFSLLCSPAFAGPGIPDFTKPDISAVNPAAAPVPGAVSEDPHRAEQKTASLDYLSVYGPAIEEIIGKQYRPEDALGFLYDLDSDGIEELVAMYLDESSIYICYSIFSIRNGVLERRVDDARLNIYFDGSAGDIGIAYYNGKPALIVHKTDNSWYPVHGISTGTDEHYIYDAGSLEQTDFLRKETNYLDHNGPVLLNEVYYRNGETIPAEAYAERTDSISYIEHLKYARYPESQTGKPLQELIPVLQNLSGRITAPHPAPDPTPAPLPASGIGWNGNVLSNIRYASDGRILSLTERSNGTVYQWHYIYDNAGRFMYRIRNIGSVPSHLTSKSMPGTDVTYSELESLLRNCVGFTIQYEVTELWKGEGLGDRYLYVYTGSAWELIGTFSYPSYGRTSAEIWMREPINIKRFTTPRIHANDSAFMIEQNLTDVWIADYSYAEPVW